MDNQAAKVIDPYLKPQDVSLQLVEPHNYRVNAAECAIQRFKNRFTGALSTMDVDFPFQLLVKLTPQFQDSISLLCRSRIKPNVSASKAHITGTDTQWRCLASKQLYSKTQTRAS
jgi:hypothetical protein